ncbi:MAG: energy transducer TonB [Saprospiraceae bacterium]|nr:energy transducer TonB [Saprospiraceae bacterium]MCB0623863.1 energy transducer TonB [Saprospiraceae bacterium]MCB0675575.1 energy transducer TonB [Saprospiraceae bacterium]MCB0684424.1 energy transducer TonB [Saprospiraceae bacterium]
MQREKKGKNFIRRPAYPGGTQAMRQFVRQQLRYPPEALAERIEGTVQVSYTIDYRGRVVETRVITGLGYGCDEEAERIVRLLRFDVPKNRKLRVRFHKKIHIHFRLPRAKRPDPPQIQYQYQSSTSQAYNYTLSWSSTSEEE